MSFTTAPVRRAGTVHQLPTPFGVGLGLGGAAVLASGLVGVVADGSGYYGEMASLAVVGASAMLGGRLLNRLQQRGRVTRAIGMAMLVAGWVAITLVSLTAFFISGEFAGVSDAVFEAVSATTTTGFTTAEAPENLTYGIRFLRVALQWTTGAGVLMAGLGVLPVAIAGAELVPHSPLEASRRLVRGLWSGTRRIFGL
ncbi:MAG: hypothetical protein HKN94_10695, partial [Acidimicrobiales bacterium]|nr:hypothetical protein [Acidimicrobiales bacterium]